MPLVFWTSSLRGLGLHTTYAIPTSIIPTCHRACRHQYTPRGIYTQYRLHVCIEACQHAESLHTLKYRNRHLCMNCMHVYKPCTRGCTPPLVICRPGLPVCPSILSPCTQKITETGIAGEHMLGSRVSSGEGCPVSWLTQGLPRRAGSQVSRPAAPVLCRAPPAWPQPQPTGAPRWLQGEYECVRTKTLLFPPQHQGPHLWEWQAHGLRGKGSHELEAGPGQSAGGSGLVGRGLGTLRG